MSIPAQIVTNATNDRQTVHVDDVFYRQCRFTRCKIVFRGTGPVQFDECVFDSCDWEFDGPAENTLLFLSALYRGLDDGGQHLVESIFQSMRTGAVDEGVLAVEPVAR